MIEQDHVPGGDPGDKAVELCPGVGMVKLVYRVYLGLYRASLSKKKEYHDGGPHMIIWIIVYSGK